MVMMVMDIRDQRGTRREGERQAMMNECECECECEM
jgi:hypothetical protein